MTDSQKKQWIENFFQGEKYKTDLFGIRFSKEEAELDHKWPLSKDGSSNFKNIKVMSSRANKEKGDKLEGKINNHSFKVTKSETLENGKIVGWIKILN